MKENVAGVERELRAKADTLNKCVRWQFIVRDNQLGIVVAWEIWDVALSADRESKAGEREFRTWDSYGIDICQRVNKKYYTGSEYVRDCPFKDNAHCIVVNEWDFDSRLEMLDLLRNEGSDKVLNRLEEMLIEYREKEFPLFVQRRHNASNI